MYFDTFEQLSIGCLYNGQVCHSEMHIKMISLRCTNTAHYYMNSKKPYKFAEKLSYYCYLRKNLKDEEKSFKRDVHNKCLVLPTTKEVCFYFSCVKS